ncbi:asparagine N-glycosylation enzyme membrane subunit Stt3 [Sphingomonas vulcanisoli]|uniref:Asparagine N-glycosylation enzyme membrane subunit Stt3 n=1 Tax=Sphingomonas vulcanisoli TaxID=1658060 RepID=A0ABX0TNW7_9SPHN|nr:hypothetical protein [Sphingomonas vulcanisoli]NIJ07216.1 asparagine N-glycosylation enzyme membrane subunit Stt3 [Sphingomonas vulcanisoli]
MRFQHPVNGYVENCSAPFLWALCFGPLYFVLKGIWRHAVLYFVVVSTLLSAWGVLAFTASFASVALLSAMKIQDPDKIAMFTAITGFALVAALVLPFLIYPFIASGIVRRHFLRQGWSEVE